jgi:hypothetical protein
LGGQKSKTPGKTHCIPKPTRNALSPEWRENMRRISNERHATQCPLITAPCREAEWAATQNLDTIQWIPYIPINTMFASRMRDVRVYHLLYLFPTSHVHPILTLQNHEFKPPEPVGGQSETATHSRSLRVAQESEIVGEEEVVDLLGRVSLAPQRKVRMRVGVRQRDLPV